MDRLFSRQPFALVLSVLVGILSYGALISSDNSKLHTAPHIDVLSLNHVQLLCAQRVTVSRHAHTLQVVYVRDIRLVVNL